MQQQQNKFDNPVQSATMCINNQQSIATKQKTKQNKTKQNKTNKTKQNKTQSKAKRKAKQASKQPACKHMLFIHACKALMCN